MEEENIKYFDFSVKNTKKEYYLLSKFYIHLLGRYFIISLYMMLFIILSVYLYKYQSFTKESLICIVFIVAYTLLIIFLPFVITSFRYSSKKNKKKVDIVINYEVYADHIDLKLSDDELFYNLKYTSIYKIYETKKHFYLFLDRNTAYIMPKKCLTGNINEFRNVIKDSAFKKYSKLM